MKRLFAAFVMVFVIFLILPLMAGATPYDIVTEVALDIQSDMLETLVSMTSDLEILNDIYPAESRNLVKSEPVLSYTDQAPTEDIAGNRPPGLRSYHIGKIQGVVNLYVKS